MSVPISDQYYYQPLMPLWLLEACQYRYEGYYDGYDTLAGTLLGDSDVFFAGENIDVGTINDWADIWIPEVGHITDGFIDSSTDVGYYWQYTLYRLDSPYPPEDAPLTTWYAMCTGLMTWQMYHIFLGQQIVRLGQFGHYGRKPNGDSNYGENSRQKK